jgi:cell division protein FtsW
LAEELGFVGVLALIALYAVVIWRAFAIAAQGVTLGQHFSGYLAYGIGLWFAIQALFNMGVNMGALPTKGLTLPLLSYGGSSVVFLCIALALLLRIGQEVTEEQAERAQRRAAGSGRGPGTGGQKPPATPTDHRPTSTGHRLPATP